MNNFWIPRPNILKIWTFVIGTLIKKSIKFSKMPFYLSKVINFAGRVLKFKKYCKLVMTFHLWFCAITAVYFKWQVTPRFFAWHQFTAYILVFVLHSLGQAVLIQDTIFTMIGKRHLKLILTIKVPTFIVKNILLHCLF